MEPINASEPALPLQNRATFRAQSRDEDLTQSGQRSAEHATHEHQALARREQERIASTRVQQGGGRREIGPPRTLQCAMTPGQTAATAPRARTSAVTTAPPQALVETRRAKARAKAPPSTRKSSTRSTTVSGPPAPTETRGTIPRVRGEPQAAARAPPIPMTHLELVERVEAWCRHPGDPTLVLTLKGTLAGPLEIIRTGRNQIRLSFAANSRWKPRDRQALADALTGKGIETTSSGEVTA